MYHKRPIVLYPYPANVYRPPRKNNGGSVHMRATPFLSPLDHGIGEATLSVCPTLCGE